MSIDFKIEEDYQGLNQLKQNINDLKQNEGPTIKEILSDEFLQEHTSFQNFNELFEKAGFKADTQEEIDAIPQDKIDNFIKENTKFDDFNMMYSTAILIYTQKHLLKGMK